MKIHQLALLSFVKNLRLKYKLSVIPLTFLIVGLINFILILNFKKEHLSDNEVVNLAGRQRMLSQRIAFFAERITKGNDDITEEYLNLIKLCDQSLQVLENGGIPPNMSENPIPPSSSGVKTELKAAKKLWEDYKQNALSLVNNPSRIKFIDENASDMLVKFNDLVKAYVRNNAQKHASLDYLLYSLLGLNIILFLIVVLVINKGIASPILKLTAQIKQLAMGKLSFIITQNSNDEVGQAISELQDLTHSFGKISSFAQQISSGNLNADYQLLSAEDEIGISLVEMQSNLKEIINETNRVVRVVGEDGQLSSRLEGKKFNGAWGELCQSINTLFESILSPIKRIESILVGLSEGNLTQRYNEDAKGDIDRLITSLNFALDHLNDLLHNISGVVSTVNESSLEMLSSGEEMDYSTSEIASAIAEMSNGAQVQVTKIDESSMLIENILNSSKGMANKSVSINEAAKRGVERSKAGADIVTNVSESINNILKVSSITNESMQKLTDRSKEIKRVLSAISEIASQTNLLALNAAIEAAQAGDAGRGFAVVAEEIRKLAEDSRSSASEIEKIIAGVTEDTEKTAQMMNEMTVTVEKGVASSNQVSQVLADIAAASSQTLNHSEEILKTSQEQTNKIKEVVNIVESIVVVSEETSAGTEQIASSSTELSAGMKSYMEKSKHLSLVAEKLRSNLEYFKLENE